MNGAAPMPAKTPQRYGMQLGYLAIDSQKWEVQEEFRESLKAALLATVDRYIEEFGPVGNISILMEIDNA